MHSLGTPIFRHHSLILQTLCLSGVGTQFLAIVTGILLMALLGMFNVHRHGSINAAAILLYAFTSCESNSFLTSVMHVFVSVVVCRQVCFKSNTQNSLLSIYVGYTVVLFTVKSDINYTIFTTPCGLWNRCGFSAYNFLHIW